MHFLLIGASLPVNARVCVCEMRSCGVNKINNIQLSLLQGQRANCILQFVSEAVQISTLLALQYKAVYILMSSHVVILHLIKDIYFGMNSEQKL